MACVRVRRGRLALDPAGTSPAAGLGQRQVGRALAGFPSKRSAGQVAAVRAARQDDDLTVDTFHLIHEALLPDEDGAGQVRDVQSWIGGSDYSPRDARYVPPPPEAVPGLPAVTGSREDATIRTLVPKLTANPVLDVRTTSELAGWERLDAHGETIDNGFVNAAPRVSRSPSPVRPDPSAQSPIAAGRNPMSASHQRALASCRSEE